MIAFLSGKIQLKTEKYIILEANGIGYKVFVSKKTLSKISEKGESIRIFTSLYLRDERVELYGFLSDKELELFEVLKEISGVGPKSSLILASFGSLEKLEQALEKADEDFFKEIKGIMTGEGKPDYAKCVDIVTKAAIKEMIVPGLLAVLTPVIVGFLGGPEMLGGVLAGVTVCGVMMALFMFMRHAGFYLK